MSTLEQMFPSLTLFSDLDWEAVTQEYEADYIDLSFPEYLQQKALDGDCPPYLFELAYYELAHYDAKNSDAAFPFKPGIYLNPTALFLSLEFDIVKMLNEAKAGNVDVFERSHVIGLFKDEHDKIHTLELSDSELGLLQNLEDGPQGSADFIGKNKREFEALVKQGLILNLL